jgi:dihydroneopterin aldolase
MTMFLASVKDAQEARVVLDRGADVIDIKDPSKGALGAAADATIREVVALIGGRRPTSAVTGDLPMEPELIGSAAARCASAGVDYVKVGLFGNDRQRARDCLKALTGLAQKTKVIAVMFADRQPDFDLLPFIAECRLAGVMLDTAEKNAGRLPDKMDIAALQAFVERARQNGLLTGLAGSLELPDVPRLLLLAPDFLGFRGALCAAGRRTFEIDTNAVQMLRQLIPTDGRVADSGVRKVDYRLLAARGYAHDSTKPSALTDRIFVRDFVMPVSIGAYAHERDRPQRVRFNVDIDVLRPGYVPEDIRDVLSYDLVTDGIKMIVAKEHIALVETLAERIARVVLSYPRVSRVTVRVEKLDVGVGAVGVEISRDRASLAQLAPTEAEADKARIDRVDGLPDGH